jgi:hypothetical protein
MTDNVVEPKKVQTEEEKSLLSEWEQYMSDFVPEDISTIVIEPRREVVRGLYNSKTKDVLRGCSRRVDVHSWRLLCWLKHYC